MDSLIKQLEEVDLVEVIGGNSVMREHVQKTQADHANNGAVNGVDKWSGKKWDVDQERVIV
jgi:hypothetical protein